MATHRKLTRLGGGTAAVLLGTLLVPVAPAQASLADVGPVQANGYPAYYEDASGLRLRLCDDPEQGCSMPELPDPSSPVSWPDNYAGENFYFAAATADASYEAALEAAFTTEEATPGEQILFSRVRIRLDGLVAGETYRITHPYGVLELTAEPDQRDPSLGRINYTDDQGCVSPPCGTFRETLAGFVGDSSATSMTFLTGAGFDPATAEAGDPIGNPLTPTAVTGSPFGTNFFRVEGRNAGGPGVHVLTQSTFTIEGQVAAPPDPARPSTPKLAPASDSGRSGTDNITNVPRPAFTGTAPAGSRVDLLVDDTVAGSGTAAADGTYSVTPTAPLAAGTRRISARASSLTSGILNILVDNAAPPATIGTPRPTNGTVDRTPTFAFSSSETGAEFTCSLTPATETLERVAEPCVSPLTYDAQANGTYTFRVRATDRAGNVGTPATHTWTIGSTPTGPAYSRDWNGDRAGDVLAVASNGDLLMYAGNGRSGFAGVSRIGTGWQNLDQVTQVGDWDRNGTPDIVARNPRTGALLLYSGNGRGSFTGSRQIGTGWQPFSAIVAPGDWSGDGTVDLLAVRADNATMWLYPGNGAGGFGVPRQVGTGWHTQGALTPVGDFDGDRRMDLISRDTATGDLRLYSGAGTGAFAGVRVIGRGWGAFTALVGPGDWDGDARPDLLARAASGDLLLYRGTGSGGFIWPYPRIGTGWASLRLLGATA